MNNQIAVNGQKEILVNHLNKAVDNGYNTIEDIKKIAVLSFKKENESILSFFDYQEVFKTYFN